MTHAHAPVPELTDGVVLLRAHTDADVPAIVEQCTDPASLRWTTVPRPYDANAAQAFLAMTRQEWAVPDRGRWWAIEWLDHPDGAPEFAGTIDLRPRGGGSAEVGFGLHPQARGHGLTARALRLVCRWWWEQGGERVTWMAMAGHLASWRVAWSCGFARHATLPGYLPHPDGLADAWVASVGREDDLDRPASLWLDPVTRESSDVRLRAWRDDDGASCEPGDSPTHFMPPGAEPTPSTFEAWVLRRRVRMSLGQSVHWCIADTAGDRARGDLCLILEGQQPGTAEIGYVLFPSARGRGLASGAVRLAIEHAWADAADGGLGLQRLLASTVADNDASARVLQRAGFAEWGHEPEFCARDDGSYDDMRHWVLLRGA